MAEKLGSKKLVQESGLLDLVTLRCTVTNFVFQSVSCCIKRPVFLFRLIVPSS